jgi:hypothetical protein
VFNSAGSQSPSEEVGGQRSSENIFGRSSGSYGVPSATSSRPGGQGPSGGSGSGEQIFDTYGATLSGVGRFVGQHPAGLRLPDTIDSPTSEHKRYILGPSAGRHMET